MAVQTDHRQAEEIEAEYDLSVVFALTRALNPVRTGQFQQVRFAMLGAPSQRFSQLLAATGAEVELVAESRTIHGTVDDTALDAAASEALRALGARAFDQRGLQPSAAALEQLQREYAARAAGGLEEDEIGYWTAVVELAAATGEVLVREHAGAWVRDPQFFSMIPFMVENGGALTNVFGKVEKFFEHGESEAPTTLLQMAADHRAEEGPLMFNLRPHDWPGRGQAQARPLLDRSDELDGSDMPLVALVHDLPNTTRTLPVEEDADKLAALEAEAEANLARLEVQIAEVGTDELKVLVVHGSFYASEKLLDRAFMLGLHERLGSELLMATVPVKGQLHVTSALTAPEQVGVFATIAARYHDEAPPNQRLSTELILVSEGRPVGLARISDGAPAPEEPKPKKGFWARLFGG